TVLLVRCFVPPQPVQIPDEPQFAGCHSWVELPEALPTKGLVPVLSDQEFAILAELVTERLSAPPEVA
ncbi:MAG: DUF1802 family protein, partial [Planctomycetaceae bacterium]|nr:DUF1802 family protein [Planctomycetaceae bacterium]